MKEQIFENEILKERDFKDVLIKELQELRHKLYSSKEEDFKESVFVSNLYDIFDACSGYMKDENVKSVLVKIPDIVNDLWFSKENKKSIKRAFTQSFFAFDTEESFEIRNNIFKKDKGLFLRSLAGVENDEANSYRKEYLSKYPDDCVLSLIGIKNINDDILDEVKNKSSLSSLIRFTLGRSDEFPHIIRLKFLYEIEKELPYYKRSNEDLITNVLYFCESMCGTAKFNEPNNPVEFKNPYHKSVYEKFRNTFGVHNEIDNLLKLCALFADDSDESVEYRERLLRYIKDKSSDLPADFCFFAEKCFVKGLAGCSCQKALEIKSKLPFPLRLVSENSFTYQVLKRLNN